MKSTKTRVLIIMLCLCLIAISGCGGESEDASEAGEVDLTADTTAVMEALGELHGELGAGDEEEFLEVLMTSEIENGVPRDTVATYPDTAEALHVWFAYDNFDPPETVSVEWIYMGDEEFRHSEEAEFDDVYGIGVFTLQRPENGWLTGEYLVSVETQGWSTIREIIHFTIENLPMSARHVEFSDDELTIPPQPPGGRWEAASIESLLLTSLLAEESVLSGIQKGPWPYLRMVPVGV